MNFLRLFIPEQATQIARQVDTFFLFLVGLSIFFSVLIAALVTYFAIRYRRRSEDEYPKGVKDSSALEVTWTVIPFVITMVIFVWSAKIYFNIAHIPADALDVYVVGKQWMWKMQHTTGRREINELHVPINRNVRLTMASEDVIHSFYVPAFRIKMDVVPGRFTSTWFRATKAGTYHLFCAEYCGTQHAGMIGHVVAMEEQDYQNWLTHGSVSKEPRAEGRVLFESLACVTCHEGQSTAGRGPSLNHLFGSKVKLADGRTVLADENYIRESILRPNAKLVAGFQAVMPSFQGTLNEDALLQLVDYIKSLSGKANP